MRSICLINQRFNDSKVGWETLETLEIVQVETYYHTVKVFSEIDLKDAHLKLALSFSQINPSFFSPFDLFC